MIHVIAAITLKTGRMDEFLEIFKANVPAVRAEAGCLAYAPAVDVASGIPVQDCNADRLVVIEQWESVAALQAHLKTPHMRAYREKTQDMVESLSLKVLQAV